MGGGVGGVEVGDVGVRGVLESGKLESVIVRNCLL